MEQENRLEILKYRKGSLRAVTRPVVREFPLRLSINGRELAVLIASPHQLNYLVAGFLHLQGFIRNLDDLLSLGICSEYGKAEIRLRGEAPERLTPTLTSGCGTGISFHLPRPEELSPATNGGKPFPPPPSCS